MIVSAAGYTISSPARDFRGYYYQVIDQILKIVGNVDFIIYNPEFMPY